MKWLEWKFINEYSPDSDYEGQTIWLYNRTGIPYAKIVAVEVNDPEPPVHSKTSDRMHYLDRENIIDIIVDCATMLDNLNISEMNRRMNVPSWVMGLINDQDFKPSRMIDRFVMYRDEGLFDSIVFGSEIENIFITVKVCQGEPPDFSEWNW